MTKFIKIENGEKTRAMIDGDTASIVDLLRKIANYLEHGELKAIGVGIAVTFADSSIATEFETGRNPVQLLGACAILEHRVYEETRK